MHRPIRPLRAFRNLTPKIAWALLCAVIALFGLNLVTNLVTRPAYTDPNFRLVKHVIDGDTLAMENGERVRLVGVDTPETKHPNKPVEHFGKEAAAFTRRIVEGKRVRLQFDFSQGQKDRYGRTLAYVFLESGLLLNAEIIKQGYGFTYTRSPFARMDEFRRLEREAREQRRGLWASN
jgi:micrococcal nuclease